MKARVFTIVVALLLMFEVIVVGNSSNITTMEDIGNDTNFAKDVDEIERNITLSQVNSDLSINNSSSSNSTDNMTLNENESKSNRIYTNVTDCILSHITYNVFYFENGHVSSIECSGKDDVAKKLDPEIIWAFIDNVIFGTDLMDHFVSSPMGDSYVSLMIEADKDVGPGLEAIDGVVGFYIHDMGEDYDIITAHTTIESICEIAELSGIRYISIPKRLNFC